MQAGFACHPSCGGHRDYRRASSPLAAKLLTVFSKLQPCELTRQSMQGDEPSFFALGQIGLGNKGI